jgi:hypothetical protein
MATHLGVGAGVLTLTGTGSPEGVVTAPVSSTFRRTDGGAGTSIYVKEVGVGAVGWSALGTSSASPWISVAGVIQEVILADTVVIGAAAMAGAEKFRIVGVTRFDGDATLNGDMTPPVDDTQVLGTDALRFNRVRATNIVAGDLHLQDEERDAHWVLREERDRIVAINKITGKRYAIALTPLEDEEEG